MKVAIGYHVQPGAWGGGNRFAKSLAAALEARGDAVVYDLSDDDIDILIMTDPRSRSSNISFAAGACLSYLKRHPQAVVIHRINECDERKGTKSMNRRLRIANYAADHTVFIASWLRDLDLWRHGPWSVVLNGGETSVFRADRNQPWDGRGPLRLVTHHWGASLMKGFDVYQELDRLIGTPSWKDKLAFTYVGNLPKGFAFTNARHVAPLDGDALAGELASHHVYVTGSRNEPAGMHHIEGALCGLPLIYRDSGALPEYCNGFGEIFGDLQSFHPALGRMMQHYDRHKAAMTGYRHTADRMAAGYLDVIDDLYDQRAEIAVARRLWRSPAAMLANKVPW